MFIVKLTLIISEVFEIATIGAQETIIANVLHLYLIIKNNYKLFIKILYIPALKVTFI